jgi:hypothetical protein
MLNLACYIVGYEVFTNRLDQHEGVLQEQAAILLNIDHLHHHPFGKANPMSIFKAII